MGVVACSYGWTSDCNQNVQQMIINIVNGLNPGVSVVHIV